MRAWGLALAAVALLGGWGSDGRSRSMQVTANAYTMRESETKKGDIGIGAWGDRLEPGMKAIAVSRDLVEAGLDHGTEVKIEGLTGSYTVRDRMNKRWKKKIDIFMGTNLEKARAWGTRTVNIRWRPAANE